MWELILFITQYYAWFNSTCYHPLPRPSPGGFAIFSHLAVYSPPPSTQKETIPHPPGLLIDHKYVVLCTKPK